MFEKNKHVSRKILTVAVLLLLILVEAIPLKGQNDLSDSMIMDRMQTIRQMLDQGKINANRWWYGWLIGYGAATLVQSSVLLTSDDKSTRQDMALGGITTLLGFAGQLITPNTAGYASARLKQLPENSQEERITKLAESEKLLKESAAREMSGKSWKIHALTGAVNLGSGLVTWIGFDRNIRAGLGNFALNTVITEAQIFTQPTRAQRDYDRYRKKYKSEREQAGDKTSLNWTVNVYPGRIAIRVVF